MLSDQKKIIKELKAGDVDAFETIYYMYGKKLYKFALGLLKDHDIASEIVHEVFVNLWEKKEQIVTTSDLSEIKLQNRINPLPQLH